MTLYLVYGFLIAAVVFCSIKIAHYVDLLDKKTNLSGAFIGGVLLAATTSLPELFTSIAAVSIIDQPALIMGNVFGSNIFNSSVMGCIILFSIKRFNKAFVSKNHAFSNIILFLITAILITLPNMYVTFFEYNINLKSIIIIVLYIIVLNSLRGDNTQDKTCLQESKMSEKDAKMSIKKITVLFIIVGACIVITSMLLTYTSDIIALKLNLDTAVAGALLLGIATSLPEVVSSISLAKLGNFNAVIGNLVGSNIFNVTILAISDLLTSKSVYILNYSTKILVSLNLLSNIVVFLLLKKKYSENSDGNKSFWFTLLSLIMIFCYIYFIVMGV